MKNSAANLNLLFKGGDAAELTIGLDPSADPKRTAARAGDLRILFSIVKGRSVAMLYRPVDPSAPVDKHATFTSPVGQTTMDRVELIEGAKVASQTKEYKDGPAWFIEASVPWKALGVTTPPAAGTKIRGDFGYLQSDGNGVQTASRKYWSGKSQTVICDIPSEARLAPALWGDFEFTKADKTVKFSSSATLDVDPANVLKSSAGEEELNQMLGE